MADMATAVVLVHGGFVDGSGWEDVYKILKKDGYSVSIVQNPTTSLADDVATKRILAGQEALVGLGWLLLWRGGDHGGRQRPQGRGAPSISRLLLRTKGSPWPRSSRIRSPARPSRRYRPRTDGRIDLSIRQSSPLPPGDVAKEKADFMANSQVPWGVEALNGTISEPAWKTKPSWDPVATDGKTIPPAAQQFMSKRAGSTVVEVKGSHAVYVSQPEAVTALIQKAAKGVKLAS